MIEGDRGMVDVPKKMKHDAIVEAMVEVQFDYSDVPEVVMGALLGMEDWDGWSKDRLPVAELPTSIRDSEAELRYQPTFQLTAPTPGRVVKLGPRVVSVHSLAPYPGWADFAPQISRTFEILYQACKTPAIHSSALRYINALTDVHGMANIWDLKLNIEVGGRRPEQDLALAYVFKTDSNMQGKVVLGTPGFVAGTPKDAAVAYADVEIRSQSAPGALSVEDLNHWIENAHRVEKDVFFSLWPEEKLQPLRED